MYLAGERATLVAPQIWGCESMLDRSSDAVFEIEFNAGRIPPLPDILYQFLGERIDFDFVGPLSVLQRKLVTTQNIQTALETGMPMLSVVPELRYKLDWEGAFEEIMSVNGMPAKYILSKDEYAAAMQKIAEQQQMMTNMEATDVLSKAAQRGSKTPETGSPVARIMEGA
jgi:hypothetical protein